jgi:hypothetical protein
MITHIFPTSVPSKFVVVTDIGASVFQGTPDTLAILLNAIAPIVTEYVLGENGDYILGEDGGKIEQE